MHRFNVVPGAERQCNLNGREESVAYDRDDLTNRSCSWRLAEYRILAWIEQNNAADEQAALLIQ